jgi:HSP20 family protein
MTDMTRYNPFGDMMTLRDAMNELLAESFVSPRRSGGGAQRAMDLYENENEYVAKLAVPGLKAEDFEITMQENTLTVSGQTREEKQDENTRYHVREHYYGAFERTVRFPGAVDAENIQAELADGILTIRVPKAAEARPKRINVRTSVN